MSKLIKVIDNQTIELISVRNPNVCFTSIDNPNPIYENYECFCDFKKQINPFELYSKSQEQKIEIKKLNKIINDLEKFLLNIHISTGYEELYKIGIKDSYDKLQELKEEVY